MFTSISVKILQANSSKKFLMCCSKYTACKSLLMPKRTSVLWLKLRELKISLNDVDEEEATKNEPSGYCGSGRFSA